MKKKFTEKEFEEIVNSEIRGQAGDDVVGLLRSDEFVLEWKFALRRILGSLKATRSLKMADGLRSVEGKEDYFRWSAKTEWFQAVVENRLEEATYLVADLYESVDERLSALEDEVYGN